MLILTRKPGESILIDRDPALDPNTSVAELFANGPIELIVTRLAGGRVRLGIAAPPGLLILRRELCLQI